jgi:hypothetical protein
MAEATEAKELTVQEAVSAAASYLKSLYPNVEGMLLEEVEITDDDRYWLVTLSFVAQSQSMVFPSMSGRKYKIVKLDRATGTVRSVKIRELENAGRRSQPPSGGPSRLRDPRRHQLVAPVSHWEA